MTSSRFLLLAAACGLAACGNYSNDDLLFMSAVPSSQHLAVVLPASTTATQAELAGDTHGGISNVNTMLDDVLGLVDTVRSYEPTSRTTDSRTWGPFADTNHPGWQWQLVVTRDPDGTTFVYHLDTENTTLLTPTWISFFTGTFDAAGGAQQGNGTIAVDFASLSAAGFPLDPSSQSLTMLTLDYQNYETAGSPVTATLVIQRIPDMTNPASSATFTYEILADGSGEIAFTLVGNVIPTTAAIETVTINAAWNSSGAGRATLAVVSGDGAGLMQVECWDDTFQPSYNNKPWAPSEDVGDPSLCPTIPSF